MDKQRLYLALFTSLILWASSFPALKVSLEGYSAFEAAALRFLIASLTLACVALRRKVRWPRKQDFPAILALAVIGVPCYHIIFNYGQLRTTASAAAFVVNISPVFTGVLAWLFLRERITRRTWLGVAICLFGVWLIARAQGGTFAMGINTLVLLLAAICWSLFCILQKPLLTSYEPFEVICYAVWIGTFFLSFLLPQALSALSTAPSSATLAIIYVGLTTALAHVAWAHVLARMPASRASVYGFLVPPLSMGIAFVWIHETPTLFFIAGGATILCGVAVATWQKALAHAGNASEHGSQPCTFEKPDPMTR